MIEFDSMELKDIVENANKLSIYYLPAFIALYFGGILMAEFGAQKGIVYKIINGTS